MCCKVRVRDCSDTQRARTAQFLGWSGFKVFETKRLNRSHPMSASSGPTWERELRALNMSKNTKQVNVMVVSRGVISLSRSWERRRTRQRTDHMDAH